MATGRCCAVPGHWRGRTAACWCRCSSTRSSSARVRTSTAIPVRSRRTWRSAPRRGSRPGFFTGVLTVVLKLFQLARPDAAVFGEKDAQQLALVRRMCADLNLGIEIAAEPTVRDADGLAVSSRNGYLSAAERRSALAIPRALEAGAKQAAEGPAAVLEAARAVLDEAAAADPPLELDYLALADPESFTDLPASHRGPALLLIAARTGTTRLIDNVRVEIGAPPAPHHLPGG